MGQDTYGCSGVCVEFDVTFDNMSKIAALRRVKNVKLYVRDVDCDVMYQIDDVFDGLPQQSREEFDKVVSEFGSGRVIAFIRVSSSHVHNLCSRRSACHYWTTANPCNVDDVIEKYRKAKQTFLDLGFDAADIKAHSMTINDF